MLYFYNPVKRKIIETLCCNKLYIAKVNGRFYSNRIYSMRRPVLRLQIIRMQMGSKLYQEKLDNLCCCISSICHIRIIYTNDLLIFVSFFLE